MLMFLADQAGTVADAMGKADGPGDHLWEDNWDDDDVDDDFTKQLRWVVVLTPVLLVFSVCSSWNLPCSGWFSEEWSDETWSLGVGSDCCFLCSREHV
jgi:hypothetical protein